MKKIRIKSKYHRIRVPQTMWLAILGVIIVLILAISATTLMAYQEPTSSQERNTILTYSSHSQFDYVANLIENTVYNKTILRPGEGIIFKQIVDSLNGSHQYRFQISESAHIQTTYSLTAIIRTDIWTKTYTLVPRQTSNSTGTRHTLNHDFPIDYRFYDSILSTINQETGITAPNPRLLLRASVSVTARTDEKTITDSFSPEITMSLDRRTIEFSDILSMQKSGSETETVTIHHPEVEQKQQNRLYITLFSVFILPGFFLTMKIKPSETSALEKRLHKVKKKYGEWLVTAESNPVDPLSKTIDIADIDELSRISEDLGKPMIHYQRNPLTNIFLVVDDTLIYRHKLSVDERKEKDFFSFFQQDKVNSKQNAKTDDSTQKEKLKNL